MAENDEGQHESIWECRECGKPINALGQWEAGEFVPTSTGSPVDGICPSKKTHPGCGDKFPVKCLRVLALIAGNDVEQQ